MFFVFTIAMLLCLISIWGRCLSLLVCRFLVFCGFSTLRVKWILSGFWEEFCCFSPSIGTEAALHLPEWPHPWAAHPRAMDQTGLRACGHHHQHHGVHLKAEGWGSGQCFHSLIYHRTLRHLFTWPGGHSYGMRPWNLWGCGFLKALDHFCWWIMISWGWGVRQTFKRRY